jgi:hypothetical protein
VKPPAASLPVFDIPHDAARSQRHVWGTKAKPSRLTPSAVLLFVSSTDCGGGKRR